METADFKRALKAWATGHRRILTAMAVALALGLAWGLALAHDKPPAPAPAPVPLVVSPAPENRCRDKFKCDHLIASGFIGVAVGRAIDANNLWRWADGQGCGVTCQRWAACLAPGVAKELSDQHRWGTGSWKDMAANALGCALGLYVSREF